MKYTDQHLDNIAALSQRIRSDQLLWKIGTDNSTGIPKLAILHGDDPAITSIWDQEASGWRPFRDLAEANETLRQKILETEQRIWTENSLAKLKIGGIYRYTYRTGSDREQDRNPARTVEFQVSDFQYLSGAWFATFGNGRSQMFHDGSPMAMHCIALDQGT